MKELSPLRLFSPARNRKRGRSDIEVETGIMISTRDENQQKKNFTHGEPDRISGPETSTSASPYW